MKPQKKDMNILNIALQEPSKMVFESWTGCFMSQKAVLKQCVNEAFHRFEWHLQDETWRNRRFN